MLQIKILVGLKFVASNKIRNGLKLRYNEKRNSNNRQR